jgi:YtkA-like
MVKTDRLFLQWSLVITLFLALCACNEAATSKFELKASSKNNRYVLTMQPATEPIVINQMHQWKLMLTDTRGKPIPHAKFQIKGGMPSHSHGLPTQPQVTQEVGNGHYLMDGMRFSMPGWWEIRVTVDADQGQDSILLNTIIPEPGSSK